MSRCLRSRSNSEPHQIIVRTTDRCACRAHEFSSASGHSTHSGLLLGVPGQELCLITDCQKKKQTHSPKTCTRDSWHLDKQPLTLFPDVDVLRAFSDESNLSLSPSENSFNKFTQRENSLTPRQQEVSKLSAFHPGQNTFHVEAAAS